MYTPLNCYAVKRSVAISLQYFMNSSVVLSMYEGPPFRADVTSDICTDRLGAVFESGRHCHLLKPLRFKNRVMVEDPVYKSIEDRL